MFVDGLLKVLFFDEKAIRVELPDEADVVVVLKVVLEHGLLELANVFDHKAFLMPIYNVIVGRILMRLLYTSNILYNSARKEELLNFLVLMMRVDFDGIWVLLNNNFSVKALWLVC